MDSYPSPSVSPLQNTSPTLNPDEVSQIQAAYNYQSEILQGFQAQLINLWAVNDHLTHYIQSLLHTGTNLVKFALPDKFVSRKM